jgi:K+-transporting ATPase c subunit
MKRTALTGLFLTAALMGSPVFAADDLCGANIASLKNAQASTSTNLGTDSKAELDKTVESATAAQKAGDEKKCIEITTKQITQLKTGGDGNDGGAAK